MTDQQQYAATGERSDHALGRWLRERLPTAATVREFVILFAVTTFLLLYGLVPTFGGDQLGLVGADEPRYAQVAREMLAAHSDACHAVTRRTRGSSAPVFPREMRAALMARSRSD